MKARMFPAIILVVSLAFILTWAVIAQSSELEPLLTDDTSSAPHLAPTVTVTSPRPQEIPPSRQTILLWPKELEQFKKEYSSWELWLGDGHLSLYSPRDELLVSVRAIAAMIPDLEVGIDELRSDIIVVSGNPAALSALVDRLRDHPLLARVTEDSPARRDEARTTWAQSKPDMNYSIPQHPSARTVNIRNNWVANVVWGYSAPGATVYVTLTRSTGHVLTTTTTADLDGLYHAFLIWEIRDGDVVEVKDGTANRMVSVIPLRASGEASTATVIGTALRASVAAGETPGQFLEVTVGKASHSVIVGSNDAFTANFQDEPFPPGTPGFLRYTDTDGNRVFQPLSASIVNIRRDTSNGSLPDGSAHSDGISSIVWGSATPSTTLVITLTRSGSLVVTRTVAADQVGSFSVSVDRLIEDGDIVQVSDSGSVRTVQVPTMTFRADPATRIITGVASAGITTTVSGAPHSLGVSIAGNTRQVTTTATGEFFADFTTSPYLAGLLGSLRYTTPSGDRVYKPLFAADPLVRGRLGDWWADTILGQPDFSQITFNEVVSNHLFNPGGVHVDRSTWPNRVYVYDAGNSRVLGLSHLGVCLAGANVGQNCTTNSDCPGSICQIQETRPADIVLGQPSFSTSACNGDSGYQMYPDVPMASAETLCGLPELANSVSEAGSGATMVTDAQGNLYVPDFFNNRVLRYDSPFTTDTIADYVWGQADFSGTTCNRGGSFGHANARSLCLTPPPGFGDLAAGVATDSAGNLWVADNENNRVLRFPFNAALGVPAPEADLVLGQPDFSTTGWGPSLNQMHNPASVRVNNSGVVYVADSLGNRVLVFEPPFSNGMNASRTLNDMQEPTGLETDSVGGLWVNDSGNNRLVHFVNEVMHDVVNQIYVGDAGGGVGVDSDSNAILAGWYTRGTLHYSSPMYTLDSVFLRSEEGGLPNQTGSRGLLGGKGLEVAVGQLIYADQSRLLFWDNPWSLTNYQAADGVVGEPDFQARKSGGPWFQRMRADRQGRLWVIHGDLSQARVYGYRLPLTTGATPIFTLTSPLPLQGGGVLTWTWSLIEGGIDIQPACDCLWLSDRDNNRVFRIRDVSTSPVVDIVLGQKSISGIHCNDGRDPDEGQPTSPTQDSLCCPGALAFDRDGNLYVADHNLETAGNWRLLEFNANTLPSAPISAVFGISATHVFGRNGDFTRDTCLPFEQDPMCGPWEPAFDSRGRMVIGFNGYLGPRFPMVYQNPLANPLPIAALGDFHSMPLSARFDQFDNLYILDHNRSRILIYRDRQVQTYTVTGTTKTAEGNPIPGVQVETIGYASSSISDPAGVYTLTGLITGTYVLAPSEDYYVFVPVTRTVSIPGAAGGQDFVGYHAPIVIGLSPNIGVNDIASNVVITGSYFLPTPTIALNTVPLSQVSWISTSTLTATVPAGLPAGVYTLTVTNPNGQLGILTNIFTVTEPPTITIITPLNGATISEVVTVTVEGKGDRVEIYLDDILHGKAGGLPANWSWSTRQAANGLHTLRAVAYGAVGRVAASPLVTVTVSNAPATTPWLQAGLNSLTVVDLAVAPTDRQVLYAASERDGVYKTLDGGMFWIRVSKGLPANASLSAIAITPNDSRVVYVGSGSGGVYKTTDDGDSWTSAGLVNTVNDLAIAHRDEQTLYAVGWGAYRTVNGGITWTPVLTDVWLSSVAIDPEDAQTAYVGMSSFSGYIYKTINGGSSWVTRTVESLSGMIQTIAIDPYETQTLYVGKPWGAVGLYKSVDGALSWVKYPFPASIQSLAVAPSDRSIVYASGQWNSVYQFRNGGTTWSDKTSGLPGKSARALTVDLSDPAIIYAGLSDGGVWKTVYIPPIGVTINGPTTGKIGMGYIFTSAVNTTATQPISYVWQTTEQSPVTHTGGLSDTVTFAWNTAGTQTIVVTATNGGGMVSSAYDFIVADIHKIYLPLVLRAQ